MRAVRPRRAAPTAGATAVAAALVLAGCSGGDDESAQAAGTPTAQASSETSSDSGGTASDSPSPSSGDTSTATSAAPSTAAPTSGATPGAGSSVGGVVEGFPIDVVPVFPDATVKLTSAVPAGDLRQVSLAASTAAPAEQVVGFYREELRAAGFTETPGPAGATFTRGGGREVLTVAVVGAGGQQQFTVGGTIAAAG